MSPAGRDVEVTVGERVLKLTNLDKVLWPEAGWTKAAMIDYYTRIAPVLLPHLANRPLTLKRYPNGVDAEYFYEKNCPKHRPPWVETAKVWSWGNDRWMDYCVAGDLPTLVWVANLASIELHTSLSLGDRIEQPRMMVFDLDPGPPAGIVDCCRVGLWLRDVFAATGLQTFAKTSGSKGLQLYIPLNTEVDYRTTKEVSKGLAQHMEREHPDHVVHQQSKALREGKVLIDWSQNDQYKTTVSVYSMRARAQPSVSTPVTWDEVSECLESGDASRLVFLAGDVLARVERHGDLFAPVLELRQQLDPTRFPTAPAPKSRAAGKAPPRPPGPEDEVARQAMQEKRRRWREEGGGPPSRRG